MKTTDLLEEGYITSYGMGTLLICRYHSSFPMATVMFLRFSSDVSVVVQLDLNVLEFSAATKQMWLGELIAVLMVIFKMPKRLAV